MTIDRSVDQRVEGLVRAWRAAGGSAAEEVAVRERIGALRAAPHEIDAEELFAIALHRATGAALTAHAATAPGEDRRGPEGALLAVGLAVVAALLVQVVRPVADGAGTVEVANAALLVIATVAVLIGLRHRAPRGRAIAGAAVLVAGALAVNLPGFAPDAATGLLVTLHLPVMLWGAVGILHGGGVGERALRRLGFARFSGEMALLVVLFALGGGVLVGLTLVLLGPVGVDEETLLGWALPSGAAGALVVASWLADGGSHSVTRLAPLLATVFTPLFALMLTVVAVANAVMGTARGFDRELLVTFDVLLVVVLALVVFGTAVREERRPAGVADAVRSVMIAAAVLLDVLVLGSMLSRIGELGLTPNRVAALGLNLVLLVNLTGSAAISTRALVRRDDLRRLADWQAVNLPVLVVWASFVVLVLPGLFRYA